MLKTVYPISQANLDYFKAKLKSLETEDNWRETQRGFNPDVVYVGAEAMKLGAKLASAVLTLTYLMQ